MLSNSLKTMKIDRNMSEFWQNVFKNYDININVFLGFIVWQVPC